MNSKPPLFVCCFALDPNRGSEYGKAFYWTSALAKYFEVHVFCHEDSVGICQKNGGTAPWIFHPISLQKTNALNFYHWYMKWCDVAVKEAEKSLKEFRPVGLHHPMLGSFRILPRYDKLGIRYTLGPLGGGETIPFPFLRSMRIPPRVRIEEMLRPLINYACVKNPLVSPVLRGAAHTFATTQQSAEVIRAGGARSVSCVFPDVFSGKINAEEVTASRKSQAGFLGEGFRLIFSGRALWWKGGHLALMVLKTLKQLEIKASLTMVTQGPAKSEWETISKNLGIDGSVTWYDFVAREELLSMYSNSHAYLYPTMHDSSSSAIPEAYSTGLPSVTLGIGGAGTASSREAGFNEFRPTAPEWIEAASQRVQEWISQPDGWMAASEGALRRASDFSVSSLEEAVEKYIVPAILRP